MQKRFKSRIAPTPSGFLHLGNALNFLLTALLVDSEKGHLHLRIDDFDNLRLNKKSVEDIFFQLEWLGIEYHSGPSGPDELISIYSQKLKNDYYFAAFPDGIPWFSTCLYLKGSAKLNDYQHR